MKIIQLIISAITAISLALIAFQLTQLSRIASPVMIIGLYYIFKDELIPSLKSKFRKI